MATPKQIKLIKLLKENYGIKGKTKTLQKMLLEAGYSEATAEADAKVILETKAVKEGTEEIIKRMVDKRNMAIIHITGEKLRKSAPRDLAYITDIFTKNIQLLSGGATERYRFINIDDEKAQRILNEYSKRGGQK